MALIINQGIQDTSKDVKDFPIIIADNVKLEVVELGLSKFAEATLTVKFRILTGEHKGKFVYDNNVPYESSNPLSWKYRSLRSCAGVPYKDGEPTNIDIEKLLLNRVVLADLSARPGKTKTGEMKDFQNIRYKKAQTSQTQPQAQPKPKPVEAVDGVNPYPYADVVLDTTVITEDDLPFDKPIAGPSSDEDWD